MTLEQDLAEAIARLESWQTQYRISLGGIGICVAVIFFSFISWMSAPLLADTSGESAVCGASLVVGVVFIGYGLLAEQKMGDAAGQVNSINQDIRRRKGAKKRKRTQERKRKDQVQKKNRELKEAKRLMEKGGIDNLNRAIGIFEKYGKK